jgi:CBS-domain-containing membrane protein
MTLSQLKSIGLSTASMALSPPARAVAFANLSHDDRAELGMTDLRVSPMISTLPHTTIAEALQHMKLSGARFLFVLDEQGHLVGSVTSYDIQGERPLRYLNSIGSTPVDGAWRDVLVRDIMDRVETWTVLEHVHVARLSLGDVATLMNAGDQRYLVVVEKIAERNAYRVRGLFSATRLQQLLGEDSAQSPVGGAARGTLAAH